MFKSSPIDRTKGFRYQVKRTSYAGRLSEESAKNLRFDYRANLKSISVDRFLIKDSTGLA